MIDLPQLDREQYQIHTSHPYPEFPIKILQFGTGAFLRGFVADYIHRANEQGFFQGQIVAIGSTGSGRVNIINTQQGVFTHQIEGLDSGKVVRKSYLNTALSHAYSASTDWEQVLHVADKEELSVVISNTTEAGLKYQPDQLDAHPPQSFPGKLTACLYRRYHTFNGDLQKGLILLPCELLTNNGDLLRQIIIQQAEEHQLEAAFIDWVRDANTFCNTLVDRIVTGTPKDSKLEESLKELEYNDQLFTLTEPFTFWAIEGPDTLKDDLPFTAVDSSILLTTDISPFRERKLRLLNGAHTISVALGYLHGLNTIRQCMEDPLMKQFIERVLYEEILLSLPNDIQGASQFAKDVLDRFSNPFLAHRLLDISMQYTSKMKMRIVPTFTRYHEKFASIPKFMTLGFAAYLYFLKPVDIEGDTYKGYRSGEAYYIKDEQALTFSQLWNTYRPDIIEKWLTDLLAREDLWGLNLNQLGDFHAKTIAYLKDFEKMGVTSTLSHALNT